MKIYIHDYIESALISIIITPINNNHPYQQLKHKDKNEERAQKAVNQLSINVIQQIIKKTPEKTQ